MMQFLLYMQHFKFHSAVCEVNLIILGYLEFHVCNKYSQHCDICDNCAAIM